MPGKLKMIFEKTFGDFFMAFRTIKPLLTSRKGDMTTTQIITILLALLGMIAIIYYMLRIKPNPETAAGCFTETVKIGPFG